MADPSIFMRIHRYTEFAKCVNIQIIGRIFRFYAEYSDIFAEISSFALVEYSQGFYVIFFT